MTSNRIVTGFINPLAFHEAEEPWASEDKKPTAATVLRFACTPGLDDAVDGIVSRYREISIETHRLFVAPAEQRLLDKLVWPLRHAKSAYMFGGYLSTIALSGMVSEMVAILTWETSQRHLNTKLLTGADEKSLFGSSFERLRQDRRIDVLSAYGLISEEIADHYTAIRQM